MEFKTIRVTANRLYSAIEDNDVYQSAIIQFGFFLIAAFFIWFVGPWLSWNHHALLDNVEKKIYLICILLLIGLLKFLMIDLDAPNPFEHKDAKMREKLLQLRRRVGGLFKFLRTTTISRHDRPISLRRLPWYLVIGPKGSGKTALLARSETKFILSKKLPITETQDFNPTEHIDWWVTRENCLIDIPGNYLFTNSPPSREDLPATLRASLWRYFLYLIRRKRGRSGIHGIVITLPLPETAKDTDRCQEILDQLLLPMQELQRFFPAATPCYLIITKCDLLPGFKEFFAESSQEDLAHTFGISLLPEKSSDSILAILRARFDALIKKLNQQLLSRLHHEYDPMARPFIKDFPLQMERLRERIEPFIKKFSVLHRERPLQGVFMISALQPANTDTHRDMNATIHEIICTNERAIQLIKEPKPSSQPYFIQQFISKVLVDTSLTTKNMTATMVRLYKYAACLIGVSFIVLAALILSHDFKHGSQQASALNKYVADYEIALRQTVNQNERLLQTIGLLNKLHNFSNTMETQNKWPSLIDFYSVNSSAKAAALYQQALQTCFLPQIQAYFANSLTIPVNKNLDEVYTMLAAYLMLNDPNHMQPDFIAGLLQQVPASALTDLQKQQLQFYFREAIKEWQPLPLNATLVAQTRSYLEAMPDNQLVYVILKNGNNNNAAISINLIPDDKLSIFTSKKMVNQIPYMFTAASFQTIYSQSISIAIKETLYGNWVLGQLVPHSTTKTMTDLLSEVQTMYVNNYVQQWENLLTNINVNTPDSLDKLDAMIVKLTDNHSPLLQLLQTFHDNTYFEPIASNSSQLYNIDLLTEKNTSAQTQLYQVFVGLATLHEYIQSVLNAENPSKAAFDIVTVRMKHPESYNPILQLRLLASHSPEPLKTWLASIADQTLRVLTQNANHYIDISYQPKPGHPATVSANI